MTANGKHGSVQEMLPLEEIVEGVLCLRGGDYRAVIQAQSVNFALKSEEEQEAVMAAYRSFLNSLSHPVQMLVRILPTAPTSPPSPTARPSAASPSTTRCSFGDSPASGRCSSGASTSSCRPGTARAKAMSRSAGPGSVPRAGATSSSSPSRRLSSMRAATRSLRG